MQPIVSLSHIQFAWPDSPIVLDIEQLDIQRGERVFLKGPSGCGKTTLLGLLGGVLQPQEGQIRILNQPIETLNSATRDHFRSDHIGYIFQMFNLLPYLSIINNITLPCRFSHKRKAVALRRSNSLQLEALRLLEHLGLDDPALLERPVSTLSIGQQQRVAAARALIGSPELVIADEPTSSLDYDSRERFLELLFSECKAAESTLLFVSHDRTLQPLFDRTIDLPTLNKASRSSDEQVV